jgi:hypothetical protein
MRVFLQVIKRKTSHAATCSSVRREELLRPSLLGFASCVISMSVSERRVPLPASDFDDVLDWCARNNSVAEIEDVPVATCSRI